MHYQKLIEDTIGENLIRIVLSKPTKAADASKVQIRPVKVKDKLLFQVTKSVGTKDSNTVKEIHENYSDRDIKNFLENVVPTMFLQGLFETEEEGYTVLANKKGTITVVKNKNVTGTKVSLDHNRTKNYLIKEGIPVPFLVDLGVMTPDGKVTKAKYDKFRQINRYLEFVDDVASKFDDSKPITIIDFGCGKSYLTFALYYYLVELRKFKARIIGLDLKTDVINECNRLRKKYKFEHLQFIEGDIEHFDGVDHVDMVMTLHACDTATDYAIYKAIKWDADVIMAVPCCQHELNRLKNSDDLLGISKYGILKERMSAIFTDAMRGNLLTQAGYETQILEFIDMEHTPKNLLIRAVKDKKGMVKKGLIEQEQKLSALIGGEITLEKLLRESDI